MTSMLPHKIGSYQVIRRIGIPDSATLYEVKNRKGDKRAIKVMAWDQAQAERDLLRPLNSPHVVKIHSVGHFGEKGYFAMEFLEGETLAHIMSAERTINPLTVVNQMFGISKALLPLWQEGNFHGDLNPYNIMRVTRERWVAFDFNCGAGYKAGIFNNGSFFGLLPFAPLERLHFFPPDQRLDFYSIGAVIYYLVTGKFIVNDLDTGALVRRLQQLSEEKVFRDASIPTPLQDFLILACNKDLAVRPADPSVFLHKLDAVRQSLAAG